MNNKIILVLVLVASIFSFNNVYAQDVCSKNGYTVISINGIFTDDIGAASNKENLKKVLPPTYNNEPVVVDYVYNATHLAGFGDLVDAARQGLFTSSSDYDLVEMLDSASQKVKTQKLLLVGHSQGNFYANSFYDKVAGKDGGVPFESIGVYGVATPDDHVSGGGKYLTSDTDTVIASIVGSLKSILKPNDHIELQKVDGNGHSFSDVYLKYRSGKIVADIKASFDKLKTNNIQNTSSSCISPQDISAIHKITGAVLAASDFIVDTGVKSTAFVYNSVKNTTTSLASTLINVAKKSFALVGLIDNNQNQIATNENIEPAPSSDALIDNSSPVVTTTPVEQVEKSVTVKEETKVEIPVVVEAQAQDVNLGTTEDTNTTSEDTLTNNSTINYGGGGSITTTPEVTNEEDINSDSNTETTDPDTTPPVIILNGEPTIDVEINGIYNEEGATAIDDVDGVINVIISGTVDTTKIGINTITYTATDTASNTSTLTRTVNVINSNSVDSKTSTLIFPRSGTFQGDGLDVSEGKKDTTVLTFQVIYRDAENNPPASLKLHIKNSTMGVYLPDVDMIQIEHGEDELSDGNYENGEIFTFNSTYDEGFYLYSVKLLDKDGNFFNINENGSLFRFTITPYDHFYIPKYTFGNENGDGNYWQVWIFNGSSIYDWSDTYVNNYLHEQFKIETYTGGFWCNNCLQRGIFNHDPQKGFDNHDVKTSSLEENPQNDSSGNTYDVDIQWDSMGYTTTIYHNNIIKSSSHTDVSDVNSDMWVGWDGVFNGFKTSPSGNWVGFWGKSEKGLMGGENMILTPYPVYNTEVENTSSDTNPVLSSEKLITSFVFETLNPRVGGVINDTTHTVNVTVPYGTDITNLSPTITVSDKATMDPNISNIKNFTNPIEYIVTAEDGSTESYMVNVVISSEVTETKSSEKLVTSFSLDSLSPVVYGDIDNTAHIVNITVPYGTDITNISPTILVSDKATVSPENLREENFTNFMEYTVTAEDGSTAVYVVTVVVSDPPVNDTNAPSVIIYSLDDVHGGIETNPITNNTHIFINASENVNWLSVKIEKADDPTVYKMFYSDSTFCVDGTDTCSKVWDGLLSSGGLLKNGNYRIRVHIQDAALNDFEGYLPITINVIGQEY